MLGMFVSYREVRATVLLNAGQVDQAGLELLDFYGGDDEVSSLVDMRIIERLGASASDCVRVPRTKDNAELRLTFGSPEDYAQYAVRQRRMPAYLWRSGKWHVARTVPEGGGACWLDLDRMWEVGAARSKRRVIAALRPVSMEIV